MSPFMCPNCGVSIGTRTYSARSYAALPPNTLNSNNGMKLSSRMQSQYLKAIASIETDISKLDEEMSRMQMIMEQLAAERQSLEKSLEERRSIVAPIRRIPLDVLSEIFIFCVDSSGPTDNSKCFDVTQAPIQLSFVCNKWRRLVISMSQLWTSILLNGGRTYVSSSGKRLNEFFMRSIETDMLNTWLSRSGSSPLTLGIDGQWLKHDALTSCIDILIAHSHRWRDVTFKLDEDHWEMLLAVKGQLPQLERFDVGVLEDVDVSVDSSDDSPYVYDIPLEIFQVAPKLHTVTMQDQIEASEWLVPWEQLRCLQFHLHLPAILPLLLPTCPNLARCTIHVYLMYDALDSLDHSSLASLHLLLHGGPNLHALFNSLTLRSLQDLDIALALGEYTLTLPQTAVASMLDRSSCNLQRLRLFRVGFTSRELIAILQAQPSLVELVIHEPSEISSPIVTKQVLKRMTLKISQSTSTESSLLIPSLKRLELFVAFAFGDQVVLDLIQSRWQRGLPQVADLESVKLGLPRKLSSETIAQLGLWREEGLNLEINVRGQAFKWP